MATLANQGRAVALRPWLGRFLPPYCAVPSPLLPWRLPVPALRGFRPCQGGVVVPTIQLPASWLLYATTGAYICPLCAQVAIAGGAVVAFDAVFKRLTIGGALLMGRAGGVFAFASASTAARWVAINQDRPQLELAALDKLSGAEAAAWKLERSAVLDEYAARIVDRMAAEPDVDKRAALLSEANFARVKWAF